MYKRLLSDCPQISLGHFLGSFWTQSQPGHMLPLFTRSPGSDILVLPTGYDYGNTWCIYFLSFLLPVTSLIAPVCSLTDPSSSMSPLLAEPFRAPSFLPSDLLIFWELVPHFLCPQFNISSVSHIFRPTSTLGLYNPLSPQLWYQSTIAVGFLKIMVNLFILRCLWPR